jgi:hypothetical protein
MSKFIKKGMQGLNFFSFGSCSVEPKPIVIDEDDDDSVQKQPISKKPKNKPLQEGKKTPQTDEDVIENKNYNLA